MTTASFFWSKLPHVPTHVRLQPCQRRRSLQQAFCAESQFVPSPKGGRTKARFHWFARYDLPAGRPHLARSATVRLCTCGLLGLQLSALTACCA
jgi:hypothetical protein